VNLLDIKDKYRVLADGDEEVWETLAKKILATSNVNILKPPSTSLVMMRARDSAEGIVFNVGEVLITECEVEIDSCRGWGYVLGDRPTIALAVAIIDAALNAAHPLVDEIVQVVNQQREELEKKKLLEFRLVNRTKVKFEVMEG
jgi:alpha-D-ribose 1-methylphosphonate 5-triphosphate synthase subunit PhnG